MMFGAFPTSEKSEMKSGISKQNIFQLLEGLAVFV